MVHHDLLCKEGVSYREIGICFAASHPALSEKIHISKGGHRAVLGSICSMCLRSFCLSYSSSIRLSKGFKSPSPIGMGIIRTYKVDRMVELQTYDGRSRYGTRHQEHAYLWNRQLILSEPNWPCVCSIPEYELSVRADLRGQSFICRLSSVP